MIDRYGNRIHVGWAEHEILWLRAAICLERQERLNAYRDISAMTGRTIESVRAQAAKIYPFPLSGSRTALVICPRPMRRPTPFVSEIKPPTKLQLMGCR